MSIELKSSKSSGENLTDGLSQPADDEPSYGLFIGDLSLFCNEDDLRAAFEPFGQLSEVRIKRNKNSKKNLSYGFIEFTSLDAAVSAMQGLDGKILCGRALKVRWAVDKPEKSGLGTEEVSEKRQKESPPTACLYVSFQCSSGSTDSRKVTEETLRELFKEFGDLTDVTIRSSTVDSSLGIQKGYGFVCYHENPEGYKSLLNALEKMANNVVDDVTYKCELSKASKAMIDKQNQDSLKAKISEQKPRKDILEKEFSSLSFSQKPPQTIQDSIARDPYPFAALNNDSPSPPSVAYPQGFPQPRNVQSQAFSRGLFDRDDSLERGNLQGYPVTSMPRHPRPPINAIFNAYPQSHQVNNYPGKLYPPRQQVPHHFRRQDANSMHRQQYPRDMDSYDDSFNRSNRGRSRVASGSFEGEFPAREVDFPSMPSHTHNVPFPRHRPPRSFHTPQQQQQFSEYERGLMDSGKLNLPPDPFFRDAPREGRGRRESFFPHSNNRASVSISAAPQGPASRFDRYFNDSSYLDAHKFEDSTPFDSSLTLGFTAGANRVPQSRISEFDYLETSGSDLQSPQSLPFFLEAFNNDEHN